MFRVLRTLTLTFLLLGLICPLHTKAESLLEARIVISELQTESANSALDDFLELTNRSEDDVDVTGWEIQTKAATSTSWFKRIVLDGIIYAGGSVILSYSDATHLYLTDIASGHFTTGLSTTGGHIRLFDTNLVVEEDKLGWGTATDAELLPAPKPLKPQSLSRKVVSDAYVDTNNNLADFELSIPSPRADNFVPEDVEEPPSEEVPPEEPPEETPPVEELSEEPAEELPPETPPEVTPEEPEEEEIALPALSLRINEILPDPKPPETDAADEWIEIYNPNAEEVNLEGYKLQTGSSFSYSFTFPSFVIAQGGYISISSGESNLVLSNSGGAVRLLDPLGGVMDSLASYTDVETGESYAWDGFTWAWTTTPTRDGENIITQLVIEPKVIKAAVKSVKKSTTVKKAATSKKKTAATVKPKVKKPVAMREVFEDPAEISSEPPLHPGVLAGTGALAILYGGYEYREDFSNKLYRFRRYLRVRRTGRR